MTNREDNSNIYIFLLSSTRKIVAFECFRFAASFLAEALINYLLSEEERHPEKWEEKPRVDEGSHLLLRGASWLSDPCIL